MRSRIHLSLKFTLALFSIFFLTMSGNVGFATSLAISPISLALSAAKPITEVDLTNNGNQTITLAFKVLSWTQHNGIDIQQENDQAILVSPPIVQIPPQKTQIVRLGLTQNVDAINEIAYRLIIQQIPIETEMDQKNGLVNVLIDFNLPIFVAPLASENLQYTWSAQIQNQNQISLKLTNSGNLHIQVSHLKIIDTTTHQKGTLLAFFYVLPSQNSTVNIPLKAKIGDTLTIDAFINGKSQTTSIKIQQ